MNENRFDLEQIRNAYPLSSFLHQLGQQPKRYSGGEHFYHSMLRDGDRNPSFCVNDKLGFWYDHGLGKGGTIFDLGKALWPTLDFKDVVEKILATMGSAHQNHVPLQPKPAQLEIPLRHPSYIVHEDLALGGNKQIKAYLQSRGVYDQSSPLRELYYSIKPEGKTRMSFAAAGWKNDLGGWEVRSSGFKGCLGNKGVNFIAGNENKVSFFEGMMDFLSWKVQSGAQGSAAIILNSVSLLSSGIKLARHFPIIDIYFDHDLAGQNATAALKEQFPWAVDRSAVYAGYNDFNEYHQSQLKARGLPECKLQSKDMNGSVDETKFLSR
ncbi:toprim domain-containing protein [Pedobacter sp. MC2016-05]|uniref:toprim domain-containing protein n=1 Tax=Pedobacter sp. MC2016-05 TaxID=2994474 RepID=UPI002245E3FF|nr:toprim domain-containing protein [Pedobacter sp. MC2016-05]MCX2476311.1 toprim domain-containing protein [Pedobacter sp. MC2016-05]